MRLEAAPEIVKDIDAISNERLIMRALAWLCWPGGQQELWAAKTGNALRDELLKRAQRP